MATFSATLTRVRNGASSGGTMPVARSIADATATAITTSSTSQQADITGGDGQYWVLTVTGGDVWVLFGTNPTAVASSGYLMTSGSTREFGVTATSEKVAVINA